METQKHHLGQQLAVLANLNGVSQVDLAKQCQISRISINRFFRGKSELKANDLLRLLSALGINVNNEIEHKLKTSLLTSR
ncbi:MAG: helix-turn-helix domain-containing protein [Bdellovibrionales bacterium]|nr:helix-turn-helix domain-containing protein [Bdellovibrionales bacterium]